MNAKPTVQKIGAVLRRAGFTRAGHTVYDTGYRVYGGSAYLLVKHYEPDAHEAGTWAEYLRKAPAALERYAEPIRAAGFSAEVEPFPDPKLIVKAAGTGAKGSLCGIHREPVKGCRLCEEG